MTLQPVLGATAADNQRVEQLYDAFDDLKAFGVVRSRMTLWRLIKNEGFPEGILISPQRRVWRRDEWQAWVANRPTKSSSAEASRSEAA
jgi:predicted DNA-binding transcriptional regulator AlpA